MIPSSDMHCFMSYFICLIHLYPRVTHLILITRD